MKARVKATGEIVELNPYCEVYEKQKEPFTSKVHKICHLEGIEIFNEPDYWTRLEHQYAGMAMQGMLSNTSLITMFFNDTKDHDEFLKEVVICSYEYAHALVQKLKDKEE